MYNQPGSEVWCANFLAPWNNHDVNAALKFFTDDAVWEFTVGSQPWGASHSGQAAIRDAISAIFEAVPDIHYELVRCGGNASCVFMEVLVTGKTRDASRLNYQACDILTLVGDKVSAKRSYRKIVSQLTQNLQGSHMVLTEDMKRLIGRARLAYVATVSSNGKPNLSPKGSIRALDDRRLGFADIESPGTVENLRRNPFIEINVVDPVLRRGYRFKGTAEVSLDEGMLRATGSDLGFAYPVRHAIVISVDEARPVLSPAYTIAQMSEHDIEETWLAHLELTRFRGRC